MKDYTKLIIPTSFQNCLTYEEQIIWLFNKLITITPGSSEEISAVKAELDKLADRVLILEDDEDEVQEAITQLSGMIAGLSGNKQDKLIPGTNITIVDNVISATGDILDTLWYPEVDDEGNLSWTRSDSPLAPDTKNIRGPKGDTGEPGFSPEVVINEVEGGHKLTIIEADGEQEFYVMDGAPGERGENGEQGPEGPKGDTGERGPAGAAATIQVGTVTTGEPGTNAAVTNSGTAQNAIFDFTIPRGDAGSGGGAINVYGVTIEKVDSGSIQANTWTKFKLVVDYEAPYFDSVMNGRVLFTPGNGNTDYIALIPAGWIRVYGVGLEQYVYLYTDTDASYSSRVCKLITF